VWASLGSRRQELCQCPKSGSARRPTRFRLGVLDYSLSRHDLYRLTLRVFLELTGRVLGKSAVNHSLGWNQLGYVMQETQPTTNPRRRLATALTVALAVVALSTYVGWSMATPQFSKEQEGTVFMLQAIQSAATTYVSVFEENPHGLGDLRIISPGLFERRTRDEILDGWGKPFHTEFHEDSWLVLSYGRAGQPGGAGLDARRIDRSAAGLVVVV
jgi:hypothetical protein